MADISDRVDFRCKPMFKTGIHKLAVREKTNTTELIVRALKLYEAGVYKSLIELRYRLPINRAQSVYDFDKKYGEKLPELEIE